jgi:predicted amidohydrolase
VTRRPLRRFVAAAVQLRSTGDLERNLAEAERLAAEAGSRGARLIAFPEHADLVLADSAVVPPAQRLDGEVARRFAEMAVRHRAYVLAGSIYERTPRGRKVRNTSILFAPSGRRVAVYRKIHLFDVAIPGRAVYRESRTVEAGTDRVLARSPLGTIGMSICYDLRFPELYRELAMAGAKILLVPSAFTTYTGRFHWAALLRARAIENLCWVIAPAQWGRHHPGRDSYGHTMIVDPWGTVVASKPRGVGVVTATIDLDRLDRLRRELPVLAHARRALRR